MKTLLTLLLTFVVVLLNCATANAQRLSVDAHIGYNQSQIKEHPTYNDPLNKMSLGLGACYHFKPYLAANVELNYEQKGGRGMVYFYNAYGQEVLSYEQTQQLFYITLPVMARCYIGKGKLQAMIDAGGYYGFLAGAWVNPQTQDLDHKVTSSFKRNDFGLIGGVGLNYQLSEVWSVTLGWRISRGFTTVSSNTNNSYNINNGGIWGVHYTIEQAND